MSLLDFQDKFPTEQICLDYLIRMRWPDGVKCSCCGGSELDFMKTRKVFECRHCRKQIYVTAGTIFHKSRVPLRKWFWAIFLMATSKKGVPMLYLQKQLGSGSYRAESGGKRIVAVDTIGQLLAFAHYLLGMGRVVPQLRILGAGIQLLQPVRGCVPAQALAQQVQRLVDLVDHGLGIGLHGVPRA
jgi:hypothetical protein